MRKITQESIDAFTSGVDFRKQNMSVEVRPFQGDSVLDSVILLLHGNPIARYVKASGLSTLQVCDGNHQTVTTKDRLNGLPGVTVNQRKGDWYLNGVKWDGSWTFVGSQLVVKPFSAAQWIVEYPHSADREPVFLPRAAAITFAHVEAANHGYKLVIDGDFVGAAA